MSSRGGWWDRRFRLSFRSFSRLLTAAAREFLIDRPTPGYAVPYPHVSCNADTIGMAMADICRKNQTTKLTILPKFTSEDEEAEWWASAEGREFVKNQTGQTNPGKKKDTPWWLF